jgi:hypothetical protein
MEHRRLPGNPAPYWENMCAILADTSSAAAGISPTVRAAAAAWAPLRSEPMVAKSVAADVIISGAVSTYDMSVHLLASPWLSLSASYF